MSFLRSLSVRMFSRVGGEACPETHFVGTVVASDVDNVGRRRFRKDADAEQAGPSSTQQAAPSPASTGLTDTTELTFHLGDQFSSFAELEKKVTAYSSAHFVQLRKRGARLIEAAKKRVGKITSKTRTMSY